MGKNWKVIFTSTLLISGAILLQSTLLKWVAFKGVKPDPALIILIFISMRKGSTVGQFSGFITGIIEDVLSLSPLGFHAFFRTTLGFFYGLIRGRIFVDPILMPAILAVIATIIKGLLSSMLVLIFSIPSVGFRIFSGPIWIEAGYNAVLAPFLFALLGLFKLLKLKKKDEL